MQPTETPTSEPAFSPLVVARKRVLARGTFGFALVHPQVARLAAFAAGSHLTVQTPSGVRRNYSLCSDPADLSNYGIAVKRDAQGRGGSISMADDVQEGDTLLVSAPRNNFALAPRAKAHLFIAGGIGITPIYSMMQHLRGAGDAPFKLIYCSRDAESTAFLVELQSSAYNSAVRVHHDGGNAAQALDLWPVLERPQTGTHVYCCGPAPLMDAVADMTGHWAPGTIHFERFGVTASSFAANQPFVARLRRSAALVDVAATQTLLEALRAGGHKVSSSCESGTCGSCRTGLLSGEVEHRDMVLSPDEQTSQIMVCVSRSKGGELVLDL